MKTTSSALTDSRILFATVVLPEPVPPQMPMIIKKTCFVLRTLCFVLCRVAESVREKEITRLGKTSKHEEQSTKNSFSEPRNNSSQQFGKLRAHRLAGGDDLIVIDRAVRNAGREVRNA